MECGHNTCRHELQQRLAELNPHMADAVRHASSAAAAAAAAGGISNRAAYERALRVGTAADARKVAAGDDAEKVSHALLFSNSAGCNWCGIHKVPKW
jgi:ADP-dependent phosphofructokinase/glucokinase